MIHCFIEGARGCTDNCMAAYSPSEGKVKGDRQCLILDSVVALGNTATGILLAQQAEVVRANKGVWPESADPPEVRT